MLEVGRDYTLTAVAAPGFTFTYWMPVNVFTFVESTYDLNGHTNTVTSTVISFVQDFSYQPALRVTLEAVDVIYDSPWRTVTESRGWLANFVPKR